jgi:DNA integrity scanning protein DisA with diadenylate cyclase activity
MSEIEESLKRIEQELSKKPRFFTIVGSILVPLAVAAVAAFVSVYTLQRNVEQSDAERNLKRVEVVSAIIKDFSSQNPEQTVLLMGIVKSAEILDSSTSEQVEKYALSLTRNKLDKAIATGGEEAARSIENTVAVIQAADTPGANQLSAEVASTKFHVIAASDTTQELAEAFKKQLIKAGYSGAQVIKTSRRFAVSVAYLPYAEAQKVEKDFGARDRFHPNYPNTAYIEARKPYWEIVE